MSRGVIGSVALVALLLAGCGAANDPAADPSPRETRAKGTPSAEPSEEPTSAPAPDSTTLTAPGTRLAVGEPGIVHVQASQPGDDVYGLVVLETTVTSIERGDPAIFQGSGNAADFEGVVPYFIRAESVILSVEGDPVMRMTPALYGVYADGAHAGELISFSGALEDVCPPGDYDELAVGHVATTCTIALGVDGNEVAGARYEGSSYADGEGDANPYWNDPVIWMR